MLKLTHCTVLKTSLHWCGFSNFNNMLHRLYTEMLVWKTRIISPIATLPVNTAVLFGGWKHKEPLKYLWFFSITFILYSKSDRCFLKKLKKHFGGIMKKKSHLSCWLGEHLRRLFYLCALTEGGLYIIVTSIFS